MVGSTTATFVHKLVLLLNVSSFVSVWLKPRDNRIGRPQRTVMERKRAAASCRTLDSFLPPENGIILRVTQLIPSLLQVSNWKRLPVRTCRSLCRICLPPLPIQSLEANRNKSALRLLFEEDASTMFLDIEDVVVKCVTDEDVVQSLRSLPASKKYTYLHHHVKPKDSLTFPTTFTGGCNRSFLSRWLKEHPWFCYCIKLDCVLKC